MITKHVRFLIYATWLVLTGMVLGQERWQWPEKPENLQVLPKEWSGARLRPVMFGFTRALGVRCSHCHVGEEGKPLSTYDFASDTNPNKERAREMLRMLGSINEHLKKIEPSGDQRVNMWCHTCHGGQPRPMTLEEALGEAYREKGVEAALERYHTLRERNYGLGAFNFGEPSLNNFGYEVLGKGEAVGAIKIFKLNAELFPESANVWDSLAEAYMTADSLDLATQYYQKSLELNPQNRNAEEMLQKIADRKQKQD